MNFTEIHSFAKDLAIQAGEIIRRERESKQVHQNYKQGSELVTSADLKSDQLIRESIQKAYPTHRILSEESSPDFKSWTDLKNYNEGPLWIIDPIDGTVNYAYGHTQTAVCIAFAMQGRIEVGIVHVPFEQETFTAIRGQGAWLNGAKIQTSGQIELKRSLIATGFPYEKEQSIDLLMKRVRTVLLNCRDIRRVGSAAIDTCWVAMGRLDGYYETVNPWDIAAAGLIAREAGARTGHLVPVPHDIPSDLFSQDVIITTPGIYDSLRAILTETEAD
jgi:myo-inositol-1(or 4)-monophosphatase